MLPAWLESWKVEYGAPAVPKETLLTEIEVTRKALAPCGYKAACVTVDKALAHFGTPDNWDSLSEDYLEEISLIPADLLPELWRKIRRECRFFPKIPDFLEKVENTISARYFRLKRLEMALFILDRSKREENK